MELSDVCKAAKYDSAAKEILEKSGWDESMRHFPGGTPFFLEKNFLEKYAPLSGMESSLLPELERAAEKTAASPEMSMLAWHIHYALFEASPVCYIAGLPHPEGFFGKDAGLFNLLCVISSFPLVEKTFTRLGLPPACFHDQCKWVGGTIGIYKETHGGYPGHNLQQTYWMRLAIDGQLFRLGRFEYQVSGIPPWCPLIFFEPRTGETKALALPGTKFDKTGNVLNDGDSATRFTAFFHDIGGNYSGIELKPDGSADPAHPVTLPRTDWVPLLSQSDLVLNIHIPSGGGMTPKAVTESLNLAVGFFPRYFKREVKLFLCNSWIMNPEWQKLLPDSNLARFQKRGSVSQGQPFNGRCGLFFIFGTDKGDPLTYKADNSVRRAMLSVLKEGRPLRGGILYLLPSQI